MVSGLVTSPCDQLRIFSGDARLMRIASKSAIGFAMSKGLERYKVILRFLQVSRACPRPSKTSSQARFSEKPARTLARGGTESRCRIGYLQKSQSRVLALSPRLSVEQLRTENRELFS